MSGDQFIAIAACISHAVADQEKPLPLPLPLEKDADPQALMTEFVLHVLAIKGASDLGIVLPNDGRVETFCQTCAKIDSSYNPNGACVIDKVFSLHLDWFYQEVAGLVSDSQAQ